MGIEKKVSKIQLSNGLQDITFNKFTDRQAINQHLMNKLFLNEPIDITRYIPKAVAWSVPDFITKRKEFSWEDTRRLYEEAVKINPDLEYNSAYATIVKTLSENCPPQAKRKLEISEKVERLSSQVEELKKNGMKKLIAKEETENTNSELAEKKIFLSDIVSDMDFRMIHSALQEEVLGQEAALKHIIKPLIDTKYRGWPRKGINATYMLGPSGVGKTSSIEHLAQELLEVPLLYVQGSDFKERHEVARLCGSPPGYVGYNPNGGLMTRFVKENEEGIILFDEIDKVHPDVYSFLISFLGDGFVTTPKGETHNFKGYVYFTSNDGNKESEAGLGTKIGFSSDNIKDSERERRKILGILRNKGISEAFLGRINEFVTFKKLPEETLYDILDKEIDEANFELFYYGISLTDYAKSQILKQGNTDKWGARNIKNLLNKYVISEINYNVEMRGLELPPDAAIEIDYAANQFTYKLQDKEIIRKSLDSFQD